LTGNNALPVSPSVGGNINIVGDGVLTTVTGNPGTNTLEITLAGAIAASYVTDSGTATPALGVLNVRGGSTGLTFTGSGNTISLSGTLDVLNGGTGNNAFVDYAPIVGGTTTTGPLQSANTGISNSGYVFTSTGATSVPTFQALPASSITIDGNSGSATGSTLTVKVNQASIPAYTGGSTVNFYASGSTNQLSFTDNLDNTGVGYNSLSTLAGAGGSNTAFGYESFAAVSSGNNNTGIGTGVGQILSTGSSNTFVGYEAGLIATSGNANTLIGVASANRLTTGQYNIIVGAATSGANPFASAGGYNYTSSESSNIIIGNIGTTGESNVIRIGTAGSSAGQQNKCYVAGIDGVNVGSVATVVTESGTQLGTAVLTAGTGISIVPTANTITISASGGGGITTIDGDSGSATGSTITFNANSNSGSTVKFTASSATVDLNVTDSNNNTIIGKSSGNGSISGSQNTGIGENCYNSLTSGSYNAALGQYCFVALTTGSSNCAVGQNILAACTSGIRNVGIGNDTMSGITTGNYNSAFGVQAASNYTGSESSNICIGYNTAGTVSESNVLRIGNGTGTGSGQLNSAYICGISGVNVGSVATVVTEASNQLGTAVLTAGTGISIVPTANTITISSSSSGFSWNDVTGGSATLAAENGYIADSGSLTTFTMPTNNSLGDTIKIVGKGSGGWKIVYSALQNIIFGNVTSTTTTGNISSNNANDCLELVCTTASIAAPIFTVVSSIGNISVN
jgi:hypothetical protein